MTGKELNILSRKPQCTEEHIHYQSDGTVLGLFLIENPKKRYWAASGKPWKDPKKHHRIGVTWNTVREISEKEFTRLRKHFDRNEETENELTKDFSTVVDTDQ